MSNDERKTGPDKAYSSGQPGSTPSDAGAAARADEYPPYTVTFVGKDGRTTPPVAGPHTESLQITAPDVDIKIVVEHQEAFDGPNLKITISRP